MKRTAEFQEFVSRTLQPNMLEERLLRLGRCPRCKKTGELEDWGGFDGDKDTPGFDFIACPDCNLFFLPRRK